ncbi:MAG: hypothetical protein Q4Q07_05695 [Tissierellia bacterium]|nr:hypothetical protein [Tissierellia bacterium]
MIITIDGNPKLIREFLVDDFRLKVANEFKHEMVFSQGIGTSCANLIAQSKEEVLLVTYFDKEIGPIYKEKLGNPYLTIEDVTIKDSIQEEVLIQDSKESTFLYSPMPRLTREEINGLFIKFQEQLPNAHVALLLQQERDYFTGEFFSECVRIAYQKAIPNVVYTNEKDLDKIIGEKPYFLLVKKEDLEKWTNLKINFSHEAEKAANILFDQGVGNVLIISKDTGAILCTKEKTFRLSSDKPKDFQLNMNFVATGIALGIERKYDWETILKLGVAIGQVEEYFGRKPLDSAKIKETMNKFKVKEI